MTADEPAADPSFTAQIFAAEPEPPAYAPEAPGDVPPIADQAEDVAPKPAEPQPEPTAAEYVAAEVAEPEAAAPPTEPEPIEESGPQTDADSETAPQPAVGRMPGAVAEDDVATRFGEAPADVSEDPPARAHDGPAATFPQVTATEEEEAPATAEPPDAPAETPPAASVAPEPPEQAPAASQFPYTVGDASEPPDGSPYGSEYPAHGQRSDLGYPDPAAFTATPEPPEAPGAPVEPPTPAAQHDPYGPYGQAPGRYGPAAQHAAQQRYGSPGGEYGQPPGQYGTDRGYADVRDRMETPPGGYPGGDDIVASDYDYEEYEPAPRRGGGKSLLLIAGVVVALIVVGGGGVAGYQIIAQQASTEAPPSPGPGTNSPGGQGATPSPTLDRAKLNSASTDPKPMTLSEVFPTDTVQVDGKAYTKVAEDLTNTCAEGGRYGFDAVLEENGCTRMLRATFVDSTQTFAVTAGIAVLPSKADAAAVNEGTALQKRTFITPLPGSPGAETIDNAYGYGDFAPAGRYYLFSFGAFTDGHKFNGQEKEQLKTQARGFRDYVAKPLRQRMLDPN